MEEKEFDPTEYDPTLIRRIDSPEDPRRCQAYTSKASQCINIGCQMPDGTYGPYCRIHGGIHNQRSFEAKQTKNYRLTKFQAQLERMTSSSDIKSLRDEIGILRILMEEYLNRCDDSIGLLQYSSTISDLAIKIEKLVSSCHRLEGSMGELLDKKALLQFAQEVITVITNHVKDTSILEAVANEIVSLVGRVGNDPKPD